MRKITRVLAVIPSETRTASAWFNGGAIAVDIVAGNLILIVEEVSKFQDPKQIKFWRRVLNRAWNIIDVLDVGVVDKLQAYCSFITMPDMCCFDCVDDGLYSWMILVYSVDYATITLQLCKQKNPLCFITVI